MDSRFHTSKVFFVISLSNPYKIKYFCLMGRSRFKITHSPVFISQRYIYICKSEPMISMIYYFYLTDSKVIQFRPKAKKLTGFTWCQALRQVLRFDPICQQVGRVRSNQ